MNMPGFSADSALYKVAGQYQPSRSAKGSHGHAEGRPHLMVTPATDQLLTIEGDSGDSNISTLPQEYCTLLAKCCAETNDWECCMYYKLYCR